MRTSILLPTGRIVAGNLYKGSDRDADGKPRTVKSGPNMGQPTVQFFIADAIPKTPGKTHWAQEEWGAPIWVVGNTAFPKIAESPTFAWKISDGDSAVPNTKGIAPNSREGYPGNWVVSLSSSYPFRIVNSDGTAPLIEPDMVKCGYYVQAYISVDGNGSTQRPGVYLNPELISYQGPGVEIRTGVDPTTVGFGKGPKPAGILAAPAGNLTPAAALTIAAPPASAPTAVVPAPGFLAPPPAAPAGPVMTPKAAGASYEAFIAQGWTDATLRANGYIV